METVITETRTEHETGTRGHISSMGMSKGTKKDSETTISCATFVGTPQSFIPSFLAVQTLQVLCSGTRVRQLGTKSSTVLVRMLGKKSATCEGPG